MTQRHLEWAGCRNVRDLGGLPLVDGRATRWRSIVRADSLDRLTPAGWNSLSVYGVRTVVDLRESDERSIDVVRPAGIAVVRVPVDDNADTAFWYRVTDDDIDGTPLYYRPFLEQKVDRCVAAVRAVAQASPGGVVIHCGIGRDRTGLVALLLLALAGVTPAAIADDYALSGERLRQHFERDDDPVVERLAARGTTIAAALHWLLSEVDVVACLRDAGLSSSDIDAVRGRMIVDNFGHGPR
jgi:protein tyrosine/serine phosphatase